MTTTALVLSWEYLTSNRVLQYNLGGSIIILVGILVKNDSHVMPAVIVQSFTNSYAVVIFGVSTAVIYSICARL